MKRCIITCIMILWCLTTVCPAQYRRGDSSGAGRSRKRNSSDSRLKIIQLSEPQTAGAISLEQALAGRRSIRQFTTQQLEFAQIGQLAWAGQGITETGRSFRTAPSAGALYPMQIYFVIRQGVFVYNPHKHSLEQTSDKDIRAELAGAALMQEAVSAAACNIVITGSARKLASKYGKKARRFMLLEAGHIAQNILLQAAALDLGAVPIGAFDINRVRKVCKLSKVLEPLYIIPVGHPRKKTEKLEDIGKAGTAKQKEAVLITASRNFRDEELFETLRALDAAAIQSVVASTQTGFITGMLGGRAEATMLVSQINVDDYDAVIFVGGPGARQYFNDPAALKIARDAAQKGKVLAAICIAPTVLAKANLLNGVKATAFPTEAVSLQSAGARYTAAAVERDGLIITANGPAAAAMFAKEIVDALEKK